MKKLIITFIVVFVSACNLYSQNKTIKGRLISDDLETVPLASIFMNDTIEVGRTDLNGCYQIDIPISENELLFVSVGMEPTKIVLAHNCYEVEIVMMLMGTYDFLTPKEVDRHRMRRFKNLSKVHKKAFSKGVFTTERACYIQEFLPHYKRISEAN